MCLISCVFIFTMYSSLALLELSDLGFAFSPICLRLRLNLRLHAPLVSNSTVSRFNLLTCFIPFNIQFFSLTKWPMMLRSNDRATFASPSRSSLPPVQFPEFRLFLSLLGSFLVLLLSPSCAACLAGVAVLKADGINIPVLQIHLGFG